MRALLTARCNGRSRASDFFRAALDTRRYRLAPSGLTDQLVVSTLVIRGTGKSCDVRAVIALRQAGTNETNARLVLRLFDGQGKQLAYADHAGGAVGVSTDPSEANQFSYLQFDLHRGTFTLWIQDAGGVAPYAADVYWTLKRK